MKLSVLSIDKVFKKSKQFFYWMKKILILLLVLLLVACTYQYDPNYELDPSYVLTNKEKKHRMMIKLENIFGLELSKKHYKLV